MSDAGPPVQESPSPVTEKHKGIFRDPVVRAMSWTAVGLVILFLITVISALATGVLAPSGPRTLAEKEVAVTGEAVRAGSTDPAVWGEYIAALIADGQYTRASSVIAEGRASIEDSQTAEFTLADARLYHAQKKYQDAIDSADAAMKQMQDYWDGQVEQGGMAAVTAQSDGLPDNYYSALLLKAYSLEELGDWDGAIAVFDLYLTDEPTAADILIDRGNAKIEAGDTSGAEDDFRAALQYIPDSTEALQGLETLGVTP